MKKSFIYITFLVFAGMLSSCSVYEKIMGKNNSTTVSGSEAKEVGVVNQTPSVAQEQSSEATSVKENHPPIMFPSTSTPAQPDTTTTAPKKTTSLSGVARVVGGSWTIIEVGDTKIDRDEDMPYIVFVPSEERFYANNGCNTLNGAYNISDDKITFHYVLSTLRFCEDVNFDHQINTIIADDVATDLRVSEKGNETFLDFVTPAGKILMRLRRINLEFLNGQWNIVGVAGLKKLSEPATVFFDLNDLDLHGNTGCNFINGKIYMDHRAPNAIDFSNIITTLRACEYPAQQTSILVALEECVSVISDGADRATLLGADGTILMELQKAK